MAAFSKEQIEKLLAPINPTRVLRDGKGNSHVSQQDVLAHLSRIFGFGNFDIEILSKELLFEQPRLTEAKPNVDHQTRWDVAYSAIVRLTVRNEGGETVSFFENGSTGDSQNTRRADAHDLAMKSAISLSVKRCCIALGDQFGLSLYNKGQTAPLVRGTMVSPDGPVSITPQGIVYAKDIDPQEGIPQQVSMGHDETEPTGQDPQAAADRATGGAQ